MLPCPSRPPAPAVGERDAPEVAAVDVRDLVVPRQPLVHERVVGGQQIARRCDPRAVGLRRTAASPAGTRRAGSRRTPDTRRRRARRRPACRASATGSRSCRRAPRDRRSASIRRTCCSRPAGVLSVPRVAASSSSSSGMLLHRKNESRDARSMSLSRYDRARQRVRRLALDAEQEARRRQHAPQRSLDAGVESVFGLARAIEREQRVEILFGHRTAIGATREPRQDRPRTALVGRRRRRQDGR